MKSIIKFIAAVGAWMLLYGSAWATPIIVYDHNGYVTGVNNLYVSGTYVNAVFLGDNVTFNQAFVDTHTTPTYLNQVGNARLAGEALTSALNANFPAAVASSAGGGALVTTLIIPDLYFPPYISYLGWGWYVTYGGANDGWFFANTQPALAIHTVFATGEASKGTSLVAFAAGTPSGPGVSTFPSSIPEPSTGALVGLGLWIIGFSLSQRRDGQG